MKIRKFLPDITVVAVVIVLSFIIGMLPSFFSSAGETFIVSDNGKTSEYSLSENREIILEHSKIIVEDGTVRVENSDCKDKICENFGRISKAGESIICIPNKLSVRISGDGEVDSVAE